MVLLVFLRDLRITLWRIGIVGAGTEARRPVRKLF